MLEKQFLSKHKLCCHDFQNKDTFETFETFEVYYQHVITAFNQVRTVDG